jgi:hemerythrin-like metal-binding protein
MRVMFEWNQKYSVGIQSIDAQHQGLFALGHELHAAMSAGQGKSALARILDRLVQYTAKHFAHEERLMRQNNYPNLAEHLEEHAALTRQVVQFQADFHAGRVAMTIQLLNFVKNWLQQHIQGSDKKYTPYLIAKEVA